ncbi:hypothetical protein BVX97_02960 [bacterium E08(2017)]|nr:hypothetical protein BVX97_02960 [bacterium E08(2017)]
MSVLIQHRSGKQHVHHIDVPKLQLEIGLFAGIFFAVLVSFTVGGQQGRLAALFASMPLVLFFRWLALPFVEMLDETEDEPQIEEDEEDVCPTVIEHVVFDEEHHGVHAQIEGDEWICVCGNRNALDEDARIQNCSKCYRCRDFVLDNYK